MSATITPRQVFEELPHDSFADYRTFEQQLIETFNRHRFEFPVGYGWRQILDWGVQTNAVRRDGGRIVITAV